MSKTDFLPSLPLRDIVILPSMIVPLFVGRDKSIKALNEVMKTNKKIVLVTQKNAEIDDPSSEDLYSYGCESKILQLLKLPDGTVKVLVEGLERVKILEYKNEDDHEYLKSLTEGMGSFEHEFEQMKTVQNKQLSDNLINEYSLKEKEE